METIIILLLVGLAAFGYWRWRTQRSGGARPPPALTIQNVRPGGLIKLTRVGPNMDDFDVTILGRHIYREDGYEWYELEGESAAGKVWLEIEEDDALELAISLRRLKLSDINQTRQSLEQIEARDAGEFVFEGQRFAYEDCGHADFLRDGDPDRREHLRYWDFEGEDGKHFIGVEAWGETEYQVHYSEALSTGQVEVFSLGGESSSRV